MSQIASVSLSVRELVEFILASGSIDNRGGGDLYQRANEERGSTASCKNNPPQPIRRNLSAPR